jgi:hypothetical protein
MKLLELHAYTKAVVVLTSINMLYNFSKILMLFISPGLFGAMVLDGIVVTLFLSATVFLLGGHGMIKYRWPGDNVYERKRGPKKLDLVFILLCFAGSLISGLIFLVHYLFVTWAIVEYRGY